MQHSDCNCNNANKIIISELPTQITAALIINNDYQDFYIYRPQNTLNIGDIYICKVLKILPALQAAFVLINKNEQAFLHINDIYIPENLSNTGNRHKIEDILKINQLILVQVLKDNPNITIELSSHTDYVGDNQFNKILSEKRAQSVVDYLIKHGIEKERLTAVGYGEEQPVVVDENLVQKYPFLKLGQPLTESYILTLTPEQQEIANQINRRTEFKVLKTTYNLY